MGLQSTFKRDIPGTKLITGIFISKIVSKREREPPTSSALPGRRHRPRAVTWSRHRRGSRSCASGANGGGPAEWGPWARPLPRRRRGAAGRKALRAHKGDFPGWRQRSSYSRQATAAGERIPEVVQDPGNWSTEQRAGGRRQRSRSRWGGCSGRMLNYSEPQPQDKERASYRCASSFILLSSRSIFPAGPLLHPHPRPGEWGRSSVFLQNHIMNQKGKIAVKRHGHLLIENCIASKRSCKFPSGKMSLEASMSLQKLRCLRNSKAFYSPFPIFT
ncbi:uncharacterized protein LOC127471865 [Manacus candei]|uniref:uncharacterized protein LOC127471865 n=1 Tax=Manacus candei TaxID=415023 RepID=UPI002225F6A1|nr:uncharacterized protein LOC127471865 [Manacus candei]